MNQQMTQTRIGDLADRTVVDSQGDKVGKVNDVYLDDDTGQPEWSAISTGMFGTKVSFVPIDGVGYDNDNNVVVAYDKATIKDAPRAEADGHLTAIEERELYVYYGRSYATAAPAGRRQTGETDRGKDRDKASMVRSEEELTVDKHRQEAGRVKLRKWVETERVQVTVPVQKQMARVVREPVGDADRSRVGGEFVDGEEEIVLSEEVVDVNKRTVAKERVGLQKETVTENVPVEETVRKERIELEGDAKTATQRDRDGR